MFQLCFPDLHNLLLPPRLGRRKFDLLYSLHGFRQYLYLFIPDRHEISLSLVVMLR